MPQNSKFQLVQGSKKSQARMGRLKTKHGLVATPAFMPIATRGSVRSLEIDALTALKASIILSNTYHLWIKPGLNLINRAGGLHKFMNWAGPILTDSGGYQVFSLSKFRKITDQGVKFRDNQDGTMRLLTPERAMSIQAILGSDIAMVLDEVPSYNSSRQVIQSAVTRSTAWAKRCLKAKSLPGQLVFSIIQGGTHKDLRINHARELIKLPFDGYAVGGLAMGESTQMQAKMIYQALNWVVPELPINKPRYLMGVGPPDQIVQAVSQGIDMFDCVLPTRNARHELLYIWKSGNLNGKFWESLNISKSRYKNDLRPIDQRCDCSTCLSYTRAYLRHLFATQDPLAQRLATIHNLRFYLRLMDEIRQAIKQGKL
ncbi:MAG: tRNA guanosine(34) transglycosylase Tgt [bacterium]